MIESMVSEFMISNHWMFLLQQMSQISQTSLTSKDLKVKFSKFVYLCYY